MRSDAGPRHSREFLSAYISGYVDGEGCFTVSISPRAKLAVGWEVRPSLSVSQNGDRAEVLHAIQAYFGCGSIRPDRSDRTSEVGDAVLGRPPRARDPSLRGLAASVWLATRLRVSRSRLQGDGGGRASNERRPDSNRRARSGDEPQREAAVRR